ncbi:hypothetical protein CLV88_12154 [Shimia abyssi]|uniref:Uncharacterized protein n=1 Tax=Shimia abyssi TaxID=1662395 RepID=A0A2P8F5Z8_9RHOB|nr:hypothetical protein CLV88_12154 [Shimia abyssi]
MTTMLVRAPAQDKKYLSIVCRRVASDNCIPLDGLDILGWQAAISLDIHAGNKVQFDFHIVDIPHALPESVQCFLIGYPCQSRSLFGSIL